MARPQNAFAYGKADIVALAVRLLVGIAQAHAFEQGNKRTSFVAIAEFLMINGYDLAIDDIAGWADEVIALVEHRSTEDDFVRPSGHSSSRGKTRKYRHNALASGDP